MIGENRIVFRRPGHTVFGSIAPLFVGEGWEWYVDAEEVRDVAFAVSIVGVDIDAFEARCRLAAVVVATAAAGAGLPAEMVIRSGISMTKSLIIFPSFVNKVR